MSPMEAILAGTKSGAECMGLQEEIGTLEPGKEADLLVVDGDPLVDIGLLDGLDHLSLVMQAGRAAAGPMVNENFQVIDKQGKVIPGLYACGNSSGGFNSYEHSLDASIGSLGRCCVSGYLAAKHAAGVLVDI